MTAARERCRRFNSDDVVRVKHDKQWLRGRVIQQHDTPRSYVVETEEGSTLRRNRRDLIRKAEEAPVCAPYIDDVPTTKNAAPSATSAPSSVSSCTDLGSSTAADPENHHQRTRCKTPVRFADYDMSASRRRQ